MEKRGSSETGNAYLAGVPEDVQYLIAEELGHVSQSSVIALGQSSQRLRQAALPFIYEEIILAKGENADTARSYKAIVQQFGVEGECTIARHVRSIVVRDGVSTDALMTVLNKVAECGNLRKFSWETSVHIARSVLDKLHTTWPDLELNVCVLDRIHAKDERHRQMDEKLLSSPLLRSLTYNVILGHYQAETPARSEWPKLTRALVAGGNLRVLRIQSQGDGEYLYGGQVLNNSEPELLMRLDLKPGMRFPALEEFVLHEVRHYGESTYLWDAQHCAMLREAMDWSKLRRLDFDGDMPTELFAALTGKLPELKRLRFGVRRDGAGDVASEFIKSVKALESLDINKPRSAFSVLWPAVMQHKDTLVELVIRDEFRGPQELPRLREVAESFPVLERLGWNVPYDLEAREAHLKLISSIGLKKLDLFFQIPWEANDYSAELVQNAWGDIPPPAFDVEQAQQAAVKMMHEISAAQIHPLDRLTLHIARTGLQDRAQEYMMYANLQVRRNKGKGPDGTDSFEFRGRQSWTGMGNLEEDSSLEGN